MKLKEQIRMWWAERLLTWAMRTAPKTIEGDTIVLMIFSYFKKAVETNPLYKAKLEDKKLREREVSNIDYSKIKTVLEKNKYIVGNAENIPYGVKLTLTNGSIVNIYQTGRISLQGKKDQKLNALFL